MQAFKVFKGMDASFWAFVKFISENLGYTERGEGLVKEYSISTIKALCEERGINASEEVIVNVAQYSKLRADLLNGYAKNMFMDAQTASEEFQNLKTIHKVGNYYCKLPLNKQKGEMKQVAFFTAIINIIAEKTIREITGNSYSMGFDDDPRSLAYIWDDGRIIGASSRRFDGAYPSIENPRLVWEIKEYYYATTFGSRVADGVYETQLDGFEFKELYERTGRKVYHVLFIDAYRTWWVQGKSYLCRLIDAMNSGVVDEVIVGREVLTRWPELLHSIIKK
ncbi:DUF7687 domain-containing protein [Beduinella massiliensis]|uniref:DUF7687 domain-containing protein n=1 Tax=Beduinella massiliensis TaxID=1852363 RepID=UPI0031F93352